jgi:hypothetical protein
MWSARLAPGGSWGGWGSFGGVLSDSPAAALDGNNLMQAFMGGSDNSIWTIGQARPAVWF